MRDLLDTIAMKFFVGLAIVFCIAMLILIATAIWYLPIPSLIFVACFGLCVAIGHFVVGKVEE